MKRTTYDKGLKAEMLAAWFLRFKGYCILARRYKTPCGEIDIVAQRGNILVFVEVKQRDCLERALEALTPQSQTRIRRAAQIYLQNDRQSQEKTSRFDVIAYIPPFSIHHLDNVQMTSA